MSLSISKIQNEPIPVPVSNPAFKGNNGTKIAGETATEAKRSGIPGIIGFALLMGLLIFGWVSSCDHKQKKSEDSTETPANLSNIPANTIDIDA